VTRKRKSKLPAEWQVYSNSNRKPVKRSGVAIWKYAVWAIVLTVLAAIAFFPKDILRLV